MLTERFGRLCDSFDTPKMARRIHYQSGKNRQFLYRMGINIFDSFMNREFESDIKMLG